MSSIPTPDGSHAVALIHQDSRGVTVLAVIDGVRYSTPEPLTEQAARDHLKVLLPWLFGGAR